MLCHGFSSLGCAGVSCGSSSWHLKRIVGLSSAGSGILFGLLYPKDEGNMILQHIGTSYPFTWCHIPEDVNHSLLLSEPWILYLAVSVSHYLTKYNYHMFAAQPTPECVVLSSFLIFVYIIFCILWNNQQMQLYAVNFIPLLGSLYMFRAAHTPIIRSTMFNCIYSHWYKP